ncbi:tautomerase family protein [Novosphingobium sp.]|uniref:tautomerase family protein n=1 Tax=Novosphingobium sp. TaxID=1874826 RepID=UPI003D0D2F1D
MPIITASILTGRNTAQKSAFIREVTAAAVRTLGVEPQQVRVLIQEIDPAHWGVAGVSKADQENKP